MQTIKSIFYRFFVWIIVFIVCFSTDFVISYWRTPKTEITVNCNFNKITEFSSLKNMKIKKYNITYNSDNPSIIIDEPGKQIDGFTEYKNFLYSPLVMYTNVYAFENDSGFAVKNTDSNLNYRTAEKNLSIILKAIEEDKTWQDIGIKENVLEGKVTLAIPDKNSPYFPYIENLFLINLEEEISDTKIDTLKTRVANIIEKCIKVEDEESYLSVNFGKDDIGKVILIAPEHLMFWSSTKMFTYYDNSSKPYFVPIYPTKTNAISYSVYIKNNLDNNTKTTILDTYCGKKFSEYTGYRTDYNNYGNKFLTVKRTISNVNIIN